MSIHYTDKENQYILDNYSKLTVRVIAGNLGKSKRMIDDKIVSFRSKGLIIGYKQSNYVPNAANVKLDMDGIRNKEFLTALRKAIKVNRYLNLIINNVPERCVVEYKNYSSFLVQRRNYKESFNFTEVLQGKIKIIS